MGDEIDILWFEGVAPERIWTLPSVRALAARGVAARLEPLPLAEATNCYYQTLTSLGSGKLGRFDATRPDAYAARDEADTPEGAWRRGLPDLVRVGGRTAARIDVAIDEAPDALMEAHADCVLARLHDAGDSDDETLDAIVRGCVERAGPEGHVIILTDISNPLPRRLVNVNNFLADVGVLEREPDGSSGKIAWPETLAYGLGTGQIWLNLRGREPKGVVTPGREADEVRATLRDLLLDEWRDPENGEPVVAQALMKEEAFTGEHVFKAPDLIVVYREGYAPSPHARALELDEASVLPGDSAAPESGASPAACLIGAGPALASGAEAAGHLVDIVPSLLYLLGMPIPHHMDGHVLTALFSPAFQEKTPVIQAASDSTLSADEEDVIVGRLQALGYIG